jgi:TonB-dependent receptor
VVINDRHKLAFNLLANRNAIDATVANQYVNRGSIAVRLSDPGPKDRYISFGYHTDDLYTGLLSGEHRFGKHRFNWSYGQSYFESYTPDLESFDLICVNQDQQLYYLQIDHIPLGDNKPRSTYKIEEDGENAGIDYSFEINTASILKAGGSYNKQYRVSRASDYYWVDPTGGGSIYLQELWAHLSELLGPDAYLEDGSGLDFQLKDNDNDYYYDNKIWAGYMAWKQALFNRKLDFYGGIRYEYEYVQLYDGDKNPVTEERSNIDGEEYVLKLEGPYLEYWLPSIYLTWNLTGQQRLKAGYGKTLDRPFSRERSFGEYTAPEEGIVYQGNKMLKNAELNNVDLRWEYYPSESEFLAAGLFYKHIKNPIEAFEWETENARKIYSVNYKKAELYGAEAEIRKNLGFIPLSWAGRFSLIANFCYTHTKMDNRFFSKGSLDWTKTDTKTGKNRPLTGTSPYLLNANLYYTGPKWNTQLALNYNWSGTRLVSVGDDDYGNLYEDPHGQLDLTLIQPWGRYVTLKAGIQNLFKGDITGWRDKDFDGEKHFDEEATNSGDKDIDIPGALRLTTNRTIYMGLTLSF